MTNDVAVFLDLDNLVIGAKQANLTFNIKLILEHIEEMTQGRIVLRRSYGEWRQSRNQMKDLAIAGFNTQSTVPINSFSKNLADMQIIVDAMGGHKVRLGCRPVVRQRRHSVVGHHVMGRVEPRKKGSPSCDEFFGGLLVC